ncbi:MAG TPA: ATP-binding protein [Casimicrobiaceae bacterium]|nr:ATP-binding protein [Casimicrobiaceae bacterium]
MTMLASLTRTLRGKLMLVVFASTFASLLFAAIALAIYEIRNYDDALIADLETQAEILARASEAPLQFNDGPVATENLALLRLRPQMRAGALYNAEGRLFASHVQGGGRVPLAPGPPGHRVQGDELVLFHPIVVQGTRVGTLYLAVRYELAQRITDTITILGAVMLASLLIAVAMSAWLQGRITRPILEVSAVARQVVERRDFTLRAEASTNDEIGFLVRAFNDMLGEVGRRAAALEAAYANLQHEIAERRSAEAALRLADRRKDEFLATLAHELRNPLAPLRNALDILRLPNLSPSRLKQVNAMMERQLRQLVRLVDDLLDVSRISTGKLTVKRERVELHGIVASAVESTRPIAEGRHQPLTVEMPEEPIWLEADTTRLAQVLANLLNNAAKYSDAGKPILLRVEAGPDAATISVIDEGIGIPADMIDRVFEMFTQVDTSLDRSTAGLGVGLSLARRLVELHGGSIRAASDGPGRGSTFTLQLPRVEALPQMHAVDAGQPAAPATRTRRILLADDNVDFASSLAIMLRGLGHEVVVAHDGAHALETAKAFRPDVAFLDIGLPKLHGYALARKLREDPQTRDAFLVAVTGWGQERDRELARDAGFDRHFVKPVGVEQIVEVLSTVP